MDVLQTARDGTRKLRWRTHDGRAIESVLIPDEDAERNRLTLCVSSQVGCAIDCRFCATATLGFGRHLGADEIVEQIYRAAALAGRRPTNLVFMGMGEPLHNFDNLTRALALLEHPWGAGFSPRRITVSTAGLVSGIDKLAELSRDGDRSAPNLAISLNATTDEVRDRIMPINKRWPIAALLDAARRWPLSHGRRVTFEYVLLAGVNDTDADADRLPVARRDPLQGEPHPLERVRRSRVRAPFGGADPVLSRAAARRRRGGLHPFAARRRHRRRLRAIAAGLADRGPWKGRAPRRTPPGKARLRPRERRLARSGLSRMGTDDELTTARDLAIDACGRIAEFWGFTRTMGRAFGLLYLSREPLAQSELQERLGISAGSASMTLAALGAGAWSTRSGCAGSGASTTRPRPTSGR